MKTELNFFTAEYPYGKHETFIENEIRITAENFDHVVIYPFRHEGSQTRELPENVKIQFLTHRKTRFVLLRNFFLVMNILFTEWYNTPSKRFFVKNLRLWLSYIKKALLLADDFKKDNEPVKKYYYSFWMNDWALVLAILKRKGIIDNFVFRCGGFDIWNERHEGNYLSFRYFIYREANAIYPNSKMGETYLKRLKYYPEKITCAYWGTPDTGINSPSLEKELVLVSCSSLIPLKRVHLIAKMLEHVKRPVKWIHFGDGILMPELKENIKQLPANVTVQIEGNKPNKFIHEYYRNYPVDFFITTSETESLPVSIQEALSYGIPVIATNVGGIHEMVNPETGYMVDASVDVEKLALLVEELPLAQWRNKQKRKEIKEFWEQRFKDSNTYTDFYTRLKQLI